MDFQTKQCLKKHSLIKVINHNITVRDFKFISTKQNLIKSSVRKQVLTF